MKKNILLSAMGLLLLASCSSDIADNSVKTSQDQVALELSGRTTLLTRSTSILPEGIKVGVYAYLKDSAIATASYPNRPYISLPNGTLSAPDTILLKIKKDYQFSTYAPYLASATSSSNLTFPIATDVLWSPVQTLLNVSQNNKSVELPFEHRGAQITFTVGFDDTYVGDKVFNSASELTVSGFFPTGRLNLATGVLVPEGTQTSTLTGVFSGTGSTASLSIPATCFAPSLVAMPLSISIKHSGRTYTGSLSKVFVAGTSYVYSILIGTQNLPLSLTGTLQDWVTQSETISIK